jgi:hypothetical protein
MEIRPSDKHEKWMVFANDLSSIESQDFVNLLNDEPPEVAILQIESLINNLYHRCWTNFTNPNRYYKFTQILSQYNNEIRSRIHDSENILNLKLLQIIRQAGCLSLVAGAGVSMEGGAPSWRELVMLLLEFALTNGREHTKWIKTSTTTDSIILKKEIIEKKYLEANEMEKAKALLRILKNGIEKIDDSILQEAAQLVHNLFDQHLFTHLSKILYDNNGPGNTCKAIAEIAAEQSETFDGRKFYGWSSIITYNYDDFIGESIDAVGIPRASYAMKGSSMWGDPNREAEKLGRDAPHLGIYHVHGYTPRRPFLITDVKFIFSLAQYDIYNSRLPEVFQEVFNRYMTRPLNHCLYVGCSFQDTNMNKLLRYAFDLLPGRYQYAFIKWEGERAFSKAGANEIKARSEKFLEIGVRPIWINSYEEIPSLISSLK